MSLLDRVKARVESDLDDAELQLMIDEAVGAIIGRFGPAADAQAPLTVTVDGRRRTIDLIRPADTTQPLAVAEAGDTWGDPDVELLDTDYTVLNGGRTLERLGTWRGWARTVTVTYVPVGDQPQRDEVVIGLVQLAVERHGVKSRKAGDLAVETVDYVAEREKLLASLAPRRGLFVR